MMIMSLIDQQYTVHSILEKEKKETKYPQSNIKQEDIVTHIYKVIRYKREAKTSVSIDKITITIRGKYISNTGHIFVNGQMNHQITTIDTYKKYRDECIRKQIQRRKGKERKG